MCTEGATHIVASAPPKKKAWKCGAVLSAYYAQHNIQLCADYAQSNFGVVQNENASRWMPLRITTQHRMKTVSAETYILQSFGWQPHTW